MTPARRAEIRAYIARLDLNQLPTLRDRNHGWTVEQRIIADLWEALPEAWDEGWRRSSWRNPYRDGEQQ